MPLCCFQKLEKRRTNGLDVGDTLAIDEKYPCASRTIYKSRHSRIRHWSTTSSAPKARRRRIPSARSLRCTHLRGEKASRVSRTAMHSQWNCCTVPPSSLMKSDSRDVNIIAAWSEDDATTPREPRKVVARRCGQLQGQQMTRVNIGATEKPSQGGGGGGWG